ncbi:siderophore biosynthesis protein, IucA/IucC family [Halobacteriovorax sp. BALOs_7]|uniref:IucA/IucC family protein n=1 Tax=Halobacteriovorax sp. BALOs_7 TaxID=2109558 RepID=UPI000EA3325D|nr:IucA/IucC family protein [Halobacteriovorax sp. BALOs_7]AYF43973.1 siderophore biosynthesis protein, IucA/IucC family [Halobacteriovorax sp. BALOs_7]
MNSHEFFNLHKKLIIKAIEELQYEELFDIEYNHSHFYLKISEEIYYTFLGRISVWDNLQIEEESFRKYSNGKVVKEYTLADFFYEVQDICKMSDDTLAQFIEEGNQTIYGDLILNETLKNINIEEIAKYNFKSVDQILSGHPKIIMNKGRLGWGKSELEKYAPESRNSYQVHWCAIAKNNLIWGLDETQLAFSTLYSDSFDETELKEIKEKIASYDLSFDDYLLVPVHPWQWNKYISIQFAPLIYKNIIISLGELGSTYTPQVSIRTLSSDTEGSQYDLKLAISILNTSCVRGIPQKYIKDGHRLSEKIEKIIASDNVLKDKVIVLKEVAAISCPMPEFDRISGGSYRYKELLGCVWRESVESKLGENEIAIPTAALLFANDKGSLVAEYIKQSRLTCEEWLKQYFESVVIPLYHLQAEHGLGLVAHGQNTIVILKNGAPQKLIIKDFHGDFRMASNSKHINEDFGVSLDTLAPEYLIHDLITGHFVTVLRYFSRVVEENLDYKERDFYHLLGRVISNYQADKNIGENINLLRVEFEKVLVNSVRFVAGYSETAQRLKPMLGNNIKNPLLSDK